MAGRVPLRLRVAAAFAGATALALIALGAFVYYRVGATLTAQTRASVATQMAALTQVPGARRPEATESMTGEFFGQVLTPGGGVVGSSPQVRGPLVAARSLPDAPGEDRTVEKQLRFVGADDAEPSTLLLRRTGGQVLVVGASKEAVDDALDGVLTQLSIGGPLALLLASGMGYLVAGAALRPIERMRLRAATISAGSVGDRLPLPAAPDELQRLGRTLNDMLDRLETALLRERRFVAEASHELRTPLALLRVELDLALSRPRTADELLSALHSANEEVDRLTRLSEDLLTLAASDEGRVGLDESEFDVGDLLESLRARFSSTAGSQGRSIGVTADHPMIVRADRGRLDRALSNLLDNALRHGEGDVRLEVVRSNGEVLIRVTDEGPGMDAELRARAFERFSRGPGARSAEGRGLGLAIVRAIVREHHGTVSIEGRHERAGTVVAIRLGAPVGSEP